MMTRVDWPYATADLPGTGGRLRTRHEDFVVDEIPQYEPSGEGEHVFVHVRKRGLATFEAMRRIAQALAVPERYVGHAGLKDKRAVTTQWLSLPDVDEDRVRALDVEGVEILEVRRHGNRLRIGHLRGNRFSVVVREAGPAHARAVFERLVAHGIPNYFGRQRFGSNRAGHLVGRALLRRDTGDFIRHFLGGDPTDEPDPWMRRARQLFNDGRLEEAHAQIPVRRRPEKKCAHALLRFDDPERAVRAVPKRMRSLLATAYQSFLFNEILARRLDSIGELQDGDIALRHQTHRVFRVPDASVEAHRCAAFEISPTGPMFGTRAMLADGEPGRLEREVFAGTDLEPEHFRVPGGILLKGLRRSLRAPLGEASLEVLDAESYRVRFVLPRGAFATSALRELMKDGSPESGPSPGNPPNSGNP